MFIRHETYLIDYAWKVSELIEFLVYYTYVVSKRTGNEMQYEFRETEMKWKAGVAAL